MFQDPGAPFPGGSFLQPAGESASTAHLVVLYVGREGSDGKPSNGTVRLARYGAAGNLDPVRVPEGEGVLTVLAENGDGTVLPRSADGTAHTFAPETLRLD